MKCVAKVAIAVIDFLRRFAKTSSEILFQLRFELPRVSIHLGQAVEWKLAISVDI
jgi:hypothetical protein